MSYSVLIADDELHARTYLKQLLKTETDLTLVGQCASGKEVIQFCKNLVPDILLLDIQMPGMNGIETAKNLMEADQKPLIIFTTAFDQYALDAFQVEALAYLLKPFSKTDLTKCLNKVRTALENQSKLEFSDRINRLWERFNRPAPVFLQYLTVKIKGLEERIDLNDVLYFISNSEYIEIHSQQGKYLQRYALKMLADQLPPQFKRIHRSIIINQQKLKSWHYLNNNTFRFDMVNDTQLVSSRTYKSDIETWLS